MLLFSCPVVSDSSWPHGEFFFFLSVRYLIWKCFLLFCGIWKFFLDSVLSYAKVLNFFDESNLSLLLFSVFWGLYLIFYLLYLLKGYEDLLLFFFSRSFMALTLTLRAVIFSSFFCMWISSCPSSFVEKTNFFSYQKSIDNKLKVNFWTPSFIPLTYLSISFVYFY